MQQAGASRRGIQVLWRSWRVYQVAIETVASGPFSPIRSHPSRSFRFNPKWQIYWLQIFLRWLNLQINRLRLNSPFRGKCFEWRHGGEIHASSINQRKNPPPGPGWPWKPFLDWMLLNAPNLMIGLLKNIHARFIRYHSTNDKIKCITGMKRGDVMAQR